MDPWLSFRRTELPSGLPPRPPFPPCIPLSLLEAIRNLDTPVEDGLDELAEEIVVRRLGLSPTVAAQIQRYRAPPSATGRWSSTRPCSVLRLVGRRPDARAGLRRRGAAGGALRRPVARRARRGPWPAVARRDRPPAGARARRRGWPAASSTASCGPGPTTAEVRMTDPLSILAAARRRRLRLLRRGLRRAAPLPHRLRGRHAARALPLAGRRGLRLADARRPRSTSDPRPGRAARGAGRGRGGRLAPVRLPRAQSGRHAGSCGSSGLNTRRLFVLLPARGRAGRGGAPDRAGSRWPDFPGRVLPYARWEELHAALGAIVAGQAAWPWRSRPRTRCPTSTGCRPAWSSCSAGWAATVVPSGAAGEPVRRRAGPATEAADHRFAAEILADGGAGGARARGARGRQRAHRDGAAGAGGRGRGGAGARLRHAADRRRSAPTRANPHYEPQPGKDAVLRAGRGGAAGPLGRPAAGHRLRRPDLDGFRREPAAGPGAAGCGRRCAGARDAAVAAVREAVGGGPADRGVRGRPRRARRDRGGRLRRSAFVHRTGHSIDRDLHGSGPHLDDYETHDDRLLLPGVGFSVEPGIYLPGEFGVRSEVNVLPGTGGPGGHAEGAAAGADRRRTERGRPSQFAGAGCRYRAVRYFPFVRSSSTSSPAAEGSAPELRTIPSQSADGLRHEAGVTHGAVPSGNFSGFRELRETWRNDQAHVTLLDTDFARIPY